MADDNALVALGERLVGQVVELGIHGGGPLTPAVDAAEQQLAAAGGDREEAIRKLVAAHVKLAAASGFVTGLGGIATLPVSVPASTAGLYVVTARMAAGIAHLRGYDVEAEEVRSTILAALLGSAGAEVLERAGVEVGQRSTVAALSRLPAPTLSDLDRRVGLRLVARSGEKGVVQLSKLIPLVGGPVGAAVDGVSAKNIAGYAMRAFPPVAPRVVRAEVVHEAVAGGEVVEGEIVHE